MQLAVTKYGAVSGTIVHLEGRNLEPVEVFKGIPFFNKYTCITKTHGYFLFVFRLELDYFINKGRKYPVYPENYRIKGSLIMQYV